MTTKTMQTLADFITANRITMQSERTDSNPVMDSGRDMDHWRVVLRCKGRQMTVIFSQGFGHNGAEPTITTVLDCLASDAASYINASNFEDWASEYGYDTDSRKAERIFKAVQRQTGKLQQLIQDAEQFDALLFNTERE